MRKTTRSPIRLAGLVCLGFALLFASGCNQVKANTQPETPSRYQATTPAPRLKAYSWMSIERWQSMHTDNLQRAHQGDIELLFMGDSITEMLANSAAWKQYYQPLAAANFGIGGDATQNLLWRIEQGELDKIAPQVTVLLIGTNNFGLFDHSVAETTAGITAVVEKIQTKLPQTQLVLLAIFPRGEQPSDPLREKIAETNKNIAKLGERPRVHYRNINEVFVQEDGRISEAVMYDYLHLTEQGNQRWAEAMAPTLRQLLQENLRN